MPALHSRRALLGAAGAALAGGLAGCIGGRVVNVLTASEAVLESPDSLSPGDDRVPLLFGSPDDDAVADLVRDITVDGERRTVVGRAPLPYARAADDERRAALVFFERDGTFYRLQLPETSDVTRTRTVFYFDLVDDGTPTGDGITVEDPTADIPEVDGRDETVVREALQSVTGDLGPVDVEDTDRPTAYWYVFREYDPAASALVPDPPFEYVAYRRGDDAVYFRPVVAERDVRERRFTYAATPVAESRSELRAYVDESVVVADFDARSLSAAERDILDTVTRAPDSFDGYEEQGEPSDAFESVLTALGLADEVGAHDEYTTTARRPFRYDDTLQLGGLTIEHHGPL